MSDTTTEGYTFDDAITNLQAIANTMTDTATETHMGSGVRLLASALDAVIENLLFILKGASISWTPTLTPEDEERIRRVKAYGTGNGPRPFTDAETWRPCPTCLGTGYKTAAAYVHGDSDDPTCPDCGGVG